MSLSCTNAVFQCPVPAKPVARLVLLVLADHADEHGVSYPSIRRIVDMTRATRRSVQYALRELERDGLIQTVVGGRASDGSRRRSSRYRILVSQLLSKGATISPSLEERAKPLHSEGATISPMRAQPLRPEGATIAPEPSLNRHIEPPLIHHEEKCAGQDTVTAERICAAYPRHVEKTAALHVIRGLINAGKPAAWLLERAEAYAAAVKRWPEADRQFVPKPAKWFWAGGFEDDPKEWERNGGAEKSASCGASCMTEEEMNRRGI